MELAVDDQDIKCSKCFSTSPASTSYCRYCHHKFTNGAAEVGDSKRRGGNKLIITGTAVLILATSYFIFK